MKNVATTIGTRAAILFWGGIILCHENTFSQQLYNYVVTAATQSQVEPTIAVSPVNPQYMMAAWMDYSPPQRDPRYLKMLRNQKVGAAADTNFTAVGRWPWGPCNDVAQDSPYFLVGNGSLIQVLLWNARTSPPKLVSEYDTGLPIYRIRARDSLAYVIAGGFLEILDVKEPSRIQLLGTMEIPDLVFQLEVVDSIAYITTLRGLLALINIRETSLPHFTSVVTVPNEWTTSLAVHDGHCYVGTLDAPILYLYDASNPDSVVYTGFLNPGVVDVAITSDTELILSVSSRTSIQFWSIAVPDTPRYLYNWSVPGYENVALNDLAVTGSKLDASHDSGVLDIILTDSTNPILAAHHAFPYKTSFGGSLIRTSEGILFAACENGLACYDASDTLRYLGFYPTSGDVVKIALRGKLAALASSIGGLWLLDISDPQTPRQITNINNGGLTGNAIISRNRLITYDEAGAGLSITNGGVYFYDISDSMHPSLLGTYVPPPLGLNAQEGAAMCLDNNLLFLAQQQSLVPPQTDLEIVDISDSLNPRQIAQLSEPFLIAQMAVSSGTLYAGSRDSGLYIFDYGSLPNMCEVRHFKEGNTESIYAIALHDSVMFLYADVRMKPDSLGFTEAWSKILAYDVNRATTPESISSFLVPPYSPPPLDIEISGNYLYTRMADSPSYAGIAGIDISDPHHLDEKAFFTATEALSLAASGGYGFIGWSQMGIIVIHNDIALDVKSARNLHVPEFYRLGQNYPNPFNPSTTIAYDIIHPALVTLKVYDILGREMATLARGIKPPGAYNTYWDATGAPSGSYFYQLRAIPLDSKDPAFTSSRRMVLVR